jgi:sulfotransferase family protein
VTRFIWLASFPKSGNTWLRALIGNTLTEEGGPVGIKALVLDGYASERSHFDFSVLIDSGLLTHDEVDCLRPRAHAALVRGTFADHLMRTDASSVRFAKVHDAYAMNSVGEPLLGGSDGAHGAIVIVRDPRDVAPSLAHHLDSSIDEAIAFMNDSSAALATKPRKQNAQLRLKLRDWSGHIASWLDQTDIPVHLIRYEDLYADTVGTLSHALGFAGLPATDEKINRAVASCDFALLSQQEQENGFAEAPRLGAKFFRRGQVGGWRDDLTVAQVARIERAHGSMMRRLGYELSHANLLADTR